MPCFQPQKKFRSKIVNSSGKRSLTSNPSQALDDKTIIHSCGQCMGCRLDRSLEWAIRCVHEASLHEHNSFITLTYSDDSLPTDGSLQLSDFQKFMKRLRFYISDSLRIRAFRKKRYIRRPPVLKFYHCGEYGEKYSRPHYHALLFNYDFPDKVFWKSVNGEDYFTSEILGKLWPQGHSMIGAVTFESAAYVARYITKKITGPMAQFVYTDLDTATGEIFAELRPEYATMSRRGGIGKGWFDQFSSDVFPSDFIILAGRKRKVPRYYLTQLQKLEGERYDSIKAAREFAAKKHLENNTPERLAVREEIQYLKAERLQRSYEK